MKIYFDCLYNTFYKKIAFDSFFWIYLSVISSLYSLKSNGKFSICFKIHHTCHKCSIISWL